MAVSTTSGPTGISITITNPTTTTFTDDGSGTIKVSVTYTLTVTVKPFFPGTSATPVTSGLWTFNNGGSTGPTTLTATVTYTGTPCEWEIMLYTHVVILAPGADSEDHTDYWDLMV